MKVKELKELTGLTLIELSKKTGISYNRISKLNREVINHSVRDHDLIREYVTNIGKNVIQVDFTPNTDKRVPFSWERRGEINLNDYRKRKDTTLSSEIQEDSKRFLGCEWVQEYHR